MRAEQTKPSETTAAPVTGDPELAETVLAFDFGTKRIGVAVGEQLIGRAWPLSTIRAEANDTRFAAIGRLIDEWQPKRLIVGLPRAMDGSEHEMTARVRRFVRQLTSRFALPVVEIDERLSSSEADACLGAAGVGWRARKDRVDAVAAQIILQDYFDAKR